MKPKQEVLILGEQQVQPHDIDTERALLATLMRYNDKFVEYSEKLSEELFFYQSEKAIFKCISGVIASGGITDINSLCYYAKMNDITIIDVDSSLEHKKNDINKHEFVKIFGLASTSTVEQDIERLTLMSRQRKGWVMLQEAASKILQPMADVSGEIGTCINSLTTLMSECDDGVSDIGTAIGELSVIVNDNIIGNKPFLVTGFKIFDEHYLLRPTTLTVIAAFSGVGKSSLAMNIAKNVAKNGNGVGYYSLEMNKEELAARAISKDAFMPSGVIMNKKLTAWQLRDFETAASKNKSLPIYIDERNTVSFEATCNSIRSLVRNNGIRLAVIDYLQIYSQIGDSEEASLGNMARMAKNVAKECNIPIILLSQLNRSGEHPSSNMLRGSGQIKESADNVVLIDRPESQKGKVVRYDGDFANVSIEGTALLILDKARGTSTDACIVGFNGNYTQFYELDEDMPFERPEPTEQDVF